MMDYELDDIDLATVEKAKEIVRCRYDGTPVKDVACEDDFAEVAELLLNVIGFDPSTLRVEDEWIPGSEPK